MWSGVGNNLSFRTYHFRHAGIKKEKKDREDSVRRRDLEVEERK